MSLQESRHRSWRVSCLGALAGLFFLSASAAGPPGLVTTPSAIDRRSSEATAAWTAAAPPAGQVVIYRDPWGVPHVHGSREADAFYGLGYAVAEDYLEDLLRQLLIARGIMAAAFGERYLEIDRLHALFRVAAEAEEGYRRLSPNLQRNLDAYAAGFAQYLARHPNEIPAWARGLVPNARDVLAFQHFFVLMFPVNSMQGIADCGRGGVSVTSTQDLYLELLRSGGPANASTAWAVAPWRTRSGAAIHLSDPHNYLDIPTPEFRLHAGSLELSGYMVGAPALLTGHSRSAAWGTTFGSPDVADCYAFPLDASDPARVRGAGAVTRRSVEIGVRDQDPRQFDLEYVRVNGYLAPIVARDAASAYAVVSPYLTGAEGSFVDLDQMGRATDMVQFRAGLSAQGLFPVGLTAADSSGNLYFARVGRTPRRSPSRDWTRPVPGEDPGTAWGGLHEFSDLIQILNPAEGYIRETNRPPASMWAPNTPFPAGRYADYIVNETAELTGSASPVSRGERSAEILSSAYGWTRDDAFALAFDERWPATPAWQAALRMALRDRVNGDRPLPSDVRRRAQQVLSFDGMAHRDSANALVFVYWMNAIFERRTAQKLTSSPPFGARVRAGAALSADEQASLLQALTDATEKLASDFPGRDAVYGEVYRYGRPGQTVPIGGCSTPYDSTLRNFVCLLDPKTGVHTAVAGQKHMMLTEFGMPLRSFSLIAFGQTWRASGSGAHRNDQTRLASDHAMKPTYFDYADLMAVKPQRRVLRTGIPLP